MMLLGKASKKFLMNLSIFAKSELQEIVELLLMKQKDMVSHMRNFANINGK